MYYLGVIADVHNDIVEVNKENNRMSSKTQIMIFPNESTHTVTCTTQWTSLTDPWLRFLLPRVQLLKKGFPDEAFWARC